jgi:molybdate transport system regulatory protein
MKQRAPGLAGRIEVRGAVWLATGNENLGGQGRMALLHAIAERGSITQAARAMGMSYKSAWDAIDAMNRLAGAPLVERVSGGRGGGSTILTPRGRQLIERFAQIDSVHRRFLQLLDAQSIDRASEFSWLDIVNMKTSARNQFLGRVSGIDRGAVNDEVELTLDSGMTIAAHIPSESTSSLELRPGCSAIALIASSSVLLATGLDGEVRTSARNQWLGTVRKLSPGAVNTDVLLELDTGGTVVATIARASVKILHLVPGSRASALVKASDVMLAVAI